MIVFQWSALAIDGHADSALRIIKRWARTGLLEIGWPSGRTYINCRDCGAIIVEYHFDDMSTFESAWESLLRCERVAAFWEELRPMLNEDHMDRQLYSVSYARDRAT
jgi:hypothetical protein